MLGGCLLPPAPDPAQQSEYVLSTFFTDPRAQALAVAAEKGNTAEVTRLMKQEGINPDEHFTDDGMPLLAWPVYTRNPEGLRAMLENGADPNVARPYPHEPGRDDTNHSNAMVWAAEESDPVYLKLLLDHGGDPNTRNSNNESLLFHAMIKQGQWQNIELLIERGADVNARAGMAASLIQSYAGMGGFQRVHWLLEHGADPTVQFYEGSPRHSSGSSTILSIYWRPTNLKPPIWQRRCQQWLLAHGYPRPPMPEHYRQMRINLGFPHEEKDIPLL